MSIKCQMYQESYFPHLSLGSKSLYICINLHVSDCEYNLIEIQFLPRVHDKRCLFQFKNKKITTTIRWSYILIVVVMLCLWHSYFGILFFRFFFLSLI